jgi:hypothetical protein
MVKLPKSMAASRLWAALLQQFGKEWTPPWNAIPPIAHPSVNRRRGWPVEAFDLSQGQ